MRTTPAILAAVLAASAFATPAVAASDRVDVKYSDLDLSTEAGQATLERRINKAAREVCGVGEVRTGTIMPSRAAQECFVQAKATVHEQVAQAIARGNTQG